MITALCAASPLPPPLSAVLPLPPPHAASETDKPNAIKLKPNNFAFFISVKPPKNSLMYLNN